MINAGLHKATAVVIGLGNPILSDDAAGIHVARKVREMMKDDDSVHVTEAYAGGVRLLDLLTGYRRAFIVDAMTTGRQPAGTIAKVSPGDITPTRNINSFHDIDLFTTIELGRSLGLPMPAQIEIMGIEAADVSSFGEDLTEDVKGAVSLAAMQIVSRLGAAGPPPGIGGEDHREGAPGRENKAPS